MPNDTPPRTELYYLYALALPDCTAEELGQGVDPRYAVELLPGGELIAVMSRVGLDEFDPAKLEQGTADVEWLGKVAFEHNRIVCQVATQHPVVPLRLGALFQTESSLRAKVSQCEDRVVEFLRNLGDRREWAVKTYLDETLAEHVLFESEEPNRQPETAIALAGMGARYLASRRQQVDRRRLLQVVANRRVQEVEVNLHAMTDCWCNLRLLPSTLTGRNEKMVGNAALLLHGCRRHVFQTTCQQLHEQLAPAGVLLEVSGPWPPYHFCPALGIGE
jgi:hypothetical protein